MRPAERFLGGDGGGGGEAVQTGCRVTAKAQWWECASSVFEGQPGADMAGASCGKETGKLDERGLGRGSEMMVRA